MINESPKPDSSSLDEIIQVLRESMPDLSERYNVKQLGVFGSYVRGEADGESDLDILVEFEEFVKDEVKILAALQALEVIGEASKRVPDSLKGKYPEIPWKGCGRYS